MMKRTRKRAASTRGTIAPSAKRRKTAEDTLQEHQEGDTEQAVATNTQHEESCSGGRGAQRREGGGDQREQGGDGQRDEGVDRQREEGGDGQRSEVGDGAEKDDGAQQKNNAAPAKQKKSARNRGLGYSVSDLLSLLDAVEGVLPACSDDWERVAVEYNKYAKKLLRCVPSFTYHR